MDPLLQYGNFYIHTAHYTYCKIAQPVYFMNAGKGLSGGRGQCFSGCQENTILIVITLPNMKRQREDPNEYLGGDLSISADVALSLGDEEESKKKLTKAERNEARKAANKKWKLVDRKVGSGKDPNPRHTVYYKIQLPELQEPGEWEKFQAALVDSLPVTFRFGGNCPTAVARNLRERMNNEFKTMRGKFVEINGIVLKDNIVKRIEWPGKDVWQISADSTTLARNPGLENLSKLLLREVELGHVVRQELASMIPALMLNVESHHNVLDVCAAPGSKTEQLLSILRSKCSDTSGICKGMVVANDADPVRINTLRRRYAHSGSPNLLVTCARAEDLQRMIGTPVFDRIVADVPCGGDGTIRKFPHIWRLFRPRMSLELHLVQLQIAISSVLLLKPGGRMVYSTCSINPLEDEAVVSGLLRRFWGRLRLVDTRAEGLLPGLITRPGLSHWQCSEEVFTCGEPDESSRKASVARLPKLTQSMHPPSAEEAALMHLERCHRVLPQDNNTGGFFVAVLELLPTSAPTDPAFLAGSDSAVTGKSTGGGKKGREVTAEASMDIMRSLGYNPKHTTRTTADAPAAGAVKAKKTPAITAASIGKQLPLVEDSRAEDDDTAAGAAEAEVDVPTVYSALSEQEQRALQKDLQLSDATVALISVPLRGEARYYTTKSTVASPASSKPPQPKPRPDTSVGIFGSRAAGWAKPAVVTADDEEVSAAKLTTRVSLVSENIHTALSTWAKDAPIFLRQAGVAVADEVQVGSSAVFTPLADAAPVLSSCVSAQCVAALAVQDFHFLLRHALAGTEQEDGAAIARFFQQVAVLSAADFSPDSVQLEDLSLEDAELQVAIATELSADALQALGEVYQRSLLGSGSFYVTRVAGCADAAPSLLLAHQQPAEGEKRRLSKAERKKLKTGPSAAGARTDGSAHLAAVAPGAGEALREKPEVLLFSASRTGRGESGVALVSSQTLCRSYSDAK